MLDLSSNYCAHLRISGEYEELQKVVLEFYNKWKPKALIGGYEEKENNHHCHVHIEFTEEQMKYQETSKGKTARSEFFKKHGFSGKYNYSKVTKTALQNIKYVIKDDEIFIYHNVTEAQIEELKQMVVKVQESMKKDARHKLLEAFNEHVEKLKTEEQINKCKLGASLANLAEWIGNYYIDVYDKEPPLSHIKGYTLYIARKQQHFQYVELQANSFYSSMFK